MNTNKNPWSDLILLLIWTLVCAFGIQLVIILFGKWLNQGLFDYLLLAGSSLSTFLLPAYIWKRKRALSEVFSDVDWKNWKPYAFGVLFLFVFGPLMSLIGDWNMQMKLPESLKGLETWMRAQEDSMADMTARLVMIKDWNRLLLNILVIGLFPAIGEEFFFRGALQHIFKRIVKNEQTAIWLVALIFSAIHFQFYGFFPRLLLGVVFGYLVVYTRNIWTAVLAHFINNTAVVLLAFYYTSQGKSYAALVSSDSYPIIVYLGSLMASIVIAYLFFQYTNKKKIYGEGLD